MFKFLHAADIHLDSPLRGLARYEDAPATAIRGATRRALENLVGLAIQEEVAFVLLAGDLYDGDWRDYQTGIFFVRQMERLNQAGIRVVVVAGNHDARSKITKRLILPDNVRVLATRRPETVVLDELGVAIHGQGFAKPKVTADLSAGFPPPVADLFNIGLLHTSLDGRPGHETYAPCTLDRLRSKGYQYWALGHVHQPEVVCDEPYVVFPGCIQGRHAREIGPKGCALVTVDDGAVAEVEHAEMDVLRWSECVVDLEDAGAEGQVARRIREAMKAHLEAAGGRPVAMRVRLLGACPMDGALKADPERWIAEARAAAAILGRDQIWVEKVKIETRPKRDLDEALASGTALGEVIAEIAAMGTRRDDIPNLDEAIETVRKALPAEVFAGEEAFDPDDPGVLRQIIEEAKALLISRMLAIEERP